MSDLRQAAQQALEALLLPTMKTQQMLIQRDEAIIALRRVLSQQAEPAAWMDREGDLYKMPEIPNWAPPHTMLYTAPPQQQSEPTSTTYTLDSTKAAVVATEFYWLPIDQNTPRGVKILLLGRGGVASLGHYHHKPGESEFWTHWAPLPKRRPE